MRRGVLGLAIASLLLFGCGDDDMTDGGRRDVPTSGPMLPTCEGPAPLTGEDGVTATIMLDTTEGQPPTLELTECTLRPSAPQVVVEYTVPGTGPHAVAISTDVPGTVVEDTMVAVRTEACGRADGRLAGALCFDDGGTTSMYRSIGSFSANGGDRVFLIVTGYNEDDRGVIQLDVTATPNTPPILEDVFVRLVEGTSLEVDVTGGDDDGNAAGIVVTMLDGIRGPVGSRLEGSFDSPVTGATRFTETATFAAGSPMGVAEATVQLYDDGHAYSDPLVVPVETGTRVAFGAACDGTTTVCSPELQCSMMICQATPDRAAVCAASPTLAPTAGMEVSEMGVLMPGMGRFRGECGATQGEELVYRVTVPMGTWDLLATTDAPGTGTDADTVVYVRRDCVNPESSSEEWCNDDNGAGLRSTLEARDLTAGTYAVFVEDYGGVAEMTTTRFELRVSLRPVLATGAPCDPDGVNDRCAAGACPAGTMVCP